MFSSTKIQRKCGNNNVGFGTRTYKTSYPLKMYESRNTAFIYFKHECIAAVYLEFAYTRIA